MLKRVRVDFDDRLWAGYERGRALPRHSLDAWMAAVARHVSSRRPLTVLDLGSGTGRFSPRLAEWFGGPVYGVEPGARMREVAARSSAHPAVTYLDGRAEKIPLPDRSCDLAFLFFVLHHFDDRRAAAAELARVVKPAGTLCVRTQFGDRLRDVVWRRYFPRALEIERAMFPTLDETTAMFALGGVRGGRARGGRVRGAPSSAAHLERLRHRAISTLELLREEEVEAGLAAMEWAAAVADDAPVREVGDLLVFRRVDKTRP